VPLDFNQLREFVEAIAKTDITDLSIKEGDFELTIRKEVQSNVIYNSLPPSPSPVTQIQEDSINMETPSPSKTKSSPSEDISQESKSSSWVEITSPMVGTFYEAPAPGESAFVNVGDSVTSGQPVCIIEAMKLMNEIEAEITGEVMEIAVKNGEPVEYGQILMWVNPG
jgi:acetyl-CoA carboxylase biotin carboxyl carrier protein